MPNPALPGARLESLIGRSLAISVHPVAAWRSRARLTRVVLVSEYFTVGYLVVLVMLQMLHG
jgi:hypothetical protein